MSNVLFVLIDAINPLLIYRYHQELLTIHQKFLHKLLAYDVLVLGNQDSILTEHRFKDLKTLYEYVAQQSYDRDILICDAYAACLSLEDSEKVLTYMRDHYYDICLTENLPEGFLPMGISHEFIGDFSRLLDIEKPVVSSLKEVINWEYQGVDVGIYLSPSLVVMNRMDFLPLNKGAIEWIMENQDKNLHLDNIDQYFDSNPKVLRNYPQYIAIELSSKNDGFYVKNFPESELSLELFRKIVTELDELAPEALISIGIWGDPMAHRSFEELFSLLNNISNTVLIECRGMVLSKELCSLVLSRPNTELIFDVSFTTEHDFSLYKKTNHRLQDTQQFIQSLTPKENVWVRLTRSKETESHIKSFLKEWKDFLPRVIITKADSFGDPRVKVVDLAPLKRHACYALRRELTILSDGSVLLCRQANIVIGNVLEESLKTIWGKNISSFLQQEQNNFDTCSLCVNCDDWWIWN